MVIMVTMVVTIVVTVIITMIIMGDMATMVIMMMSGDVEGSYSARRSRSFKSIKPKKRPWRKLPHPTLLRSL
jgi:hypothetical protein